MKNYAFIISSILYLYILKLIHFIYSYLFTHHQCSAVVSPSPITPAQSLHALAHRTATIDDGFGVAGQWDGDQTLQRDSTDWLAPSDFVKYSNAHKVSVRIISSKTAPFPRQDNKNENITRNMLIFGVIPMPIVSTRSRGVVFSAGAVRGVRERMLSAVRTGTRHKRNTRETLNCT